MRCRNNQNRTSEYIDGLLGESERQEFVEHLAACPACRMHLAETRRVVGILREASPVRPPVDLFESTMQALDRDAEPSLAVVAPPPRKWLRRFDHDIVSLARHFVVAYEFKLISYSIGMVMSCVLAIGTLNSLKPMFVALDAAKIGPTIWITVEESRVMGLEPGNGFATVAYSIPKVSEKGDLPEFVASDPAAPDGLMVLADVGPDGRASVVEILSGPSDPLTVSRLDRALDRPAFVPAKSRSRKAVPSRVILMFQQVDVIG